MKSLSPAEIVKYNYRRELIAQKIKDVSPFELMNGDITYIYDCTHDILTATQAELKYARFLGAHDSIYKLSDFAKNAEFGGKGNGLKREDDALNSLNAQLEAIKAEWGVTSIPVCCGSNIFQITCAMSTSGTPKSDFELVDRNAESAIWISHKHGTKPTHFQQWGGISEAADPYIANHLEVKAFADAISKKYPNGLPAKTTLYRPIKSGNLKCHSVYGKEVHRGQSKNSVSLVLQGDVKLVWNWIGEYYTIQGSTHTHFCGEEITGDYEPTLYAVYKTDRSDKGIKNCRITINPLASRNKRILI